MPCCTWYHIFRSQNHQNCLKWQRRSTRPNSVRRSATCWLQGFWTWQISVLRSPNTMGYWVRDRVRDSSQYCKCSRVEGGRYVSMSGVHFTPVTTLQLTTIGRGSASTLCSRPGVGPRRPGPPPLRAACRRCDFWRSNHVVNQTVAEIRLVGYLGICQKR